MAVCDPFRQNLKQTLADNFLSRFGVFSDDKWFISVGNIIPWTGTTGTVNDNAPPQNTDSIKSDTDFWRYALAMKRVQKSDVSFVVPRYDWVSGNIYVPYRNTTALFNPNQQFYVLVDQERVYKCIDNNYGVASTVAPTHTDSQIRILSDGYRWKYLYTITESTSKFLTSGSSGKNGYMPVQYVDFLTDNDDRVLQWSVQQAAVTGSIDYIALDQNMRSNIVSDRVVFYDSANIVISATGASATQVTIGGPNLVAAQSYYTGMVWRVESGLGAGQQRVIKSHTLASNSTANLVIDPLDVGVTGGTGADASIYSILPRVIISGDGTSNFNSLNTSSTSAEATAKFLSSAGGATGQKYLDTIEIVDPGKNYTYATVSFGLGLTFAPGTSGNIGNLATAIIPPPGGHGFNPVKELGCSDLMIVLAFNEDESGKLTTGNDYRQFALVKNPQLQEQRVRLLFDKAGLSASFTVGNTAGQGSTGPGGLTFDTVTGTITEWNPGTLGTTNTSELSFTNIRNGTFKVGGVVSGFNIVNVQNKTVAGTEGRLTKKLKLSPLGTAATFNPTGVDFTPRYIALGLGNTASNINRTYANGRIYRWQPEAGTNQVGSLYLEYPNGNFLINENVGQIFNISTVTGPSGKVIQIEDYEFVPQTVYSQTKTVIISWNGGTPLKADSFSKDELVTVYLEPTVVGSVHTYKGSGYIVDWTPSGTTGALRLTGLDGIFLTGHTIPYNQGLVDSTILSISSEPEIKYRTGDIMHIQNIRPITRSLDQKEEIKFIVEF